MNGQHWLPLLALVAACAAAPSRQELGRREKLRILVDKVMQPTEGWVTKEWMVKAAADAGFNVFSPRRGHDSLDQVRQVTQWCEKHGIYHMPWMRGSLNAPVGHEADGKRVMWADGAEQPLWSPNSDEFWAWTSRYIVEYAKVSAQSKHLMGVFLDYENYEKGGQGNLYALSYDGLILEKFAAARGVQLPELKPSERAEWLRKQGLHDAFAAFQVAHWRGRCRALRKAVDAHDGTFQFCVYPAPGTPFMVEAVYPEWATEAAPLILADASTYGRPSRLLAEAAAVQGNRQRLLANRRTPAERGIPHIYAGGIDPAVKGADPEFCGKNAVGISDVTDGYWVFYEGPKYEEDHPAYWKWFAWANKAIAAGNFAAQNEPRQTPDSWSLDLLQRLGKGAKLVPPPVTGETVKFPTVKLRGENLLLVAAKAGTPAALTLQHHPVARYESPLEWELHDPASKRIASGAVPQGASGAVKFTPVAGGVYALAVSAGQCAYSVESANAPVALHAGEGLSLIYGARRLYFRVPEGVARFTLAVRGSGSETVRLNVFDPHGKEGGSVQTTAKSDRASLRVASGEAGGGTWSLELTRAAEGVLEDSTVQLGQELPPTVALDPAHVFGVAAPGAYR